MKLNIKKTSFYSAIALSSFMMVSCNDFLDKEPISSITPEQYFVSSDQLAAYAINYYTSVFSTWQGNFNAGPDNADSDTDNQIVGEADLTHYAPGHWLVSSEKSIGFGTIRAMNYFLDKVLPKYKAEQITGADADIQQYIGEIYYMRASAYFDQLVNFGDFPIVTSVLTDDKDQLIEASKRAPRNEVARFIIANCDTAISMLKTASTYKKNRISKELAQLLKARVALFEASFEKYHKGTPRVPGEQGWPGANMSYNKGKTFNIDSEISYFLTTAMEASSALADSHTLVTNSGQYEPKLHQYYSWNPYFEMFSMPTPNTVDEVLFYRAYSMSESVTTGYNAYIAYGGNNGMTKSCVDAFLMSNGLPIYAANSGYKGDETIDMQKEGRDGRLRLFLFSEGSSLYTNGDTITYYIPTIIDLTEHRDRTGFRLRKHYSYSPDQFGTGNVGTNGYIVARATEAYLIYLEASYMKNGNLDSKADAYWRALRTRAGVDPDYNKTIAATDLSKEPDWAKYSGSTLVDKTLYNIRRERRCEFIGEGMRWRDLIRWRAFDALFDGNMGRYIPQGINLWTKIYSYPEYFKRDASGKPTSVSALIPQAAGVADANVSSLANSGKYLCPYRIVKENNEVWDGYQWKKAYYLAPLGIKDLTLTSTATDKTDAAAVMAASTMYQNPYWPTIASGSAIE